MICVNKGKLALHEIFENDIDQEAVTRNISRRHGRIEWIATYLVQEN